MKPIYAVQTTLSMGGIVFFNNTQKTDNLHEALNIVEDRLGEIKHVYPSMSIKKTKTGYVALGKNETKAEIIIREDVSPLTNRIEELEKDLAAASAQKSEQEDALTLVGVVLIFG